MEVFLFLIFLFDRTGSDKVGAHCHTYRRLHTIELILSHNDVHVLRVGRIRTQHSEVLVVEAIHNNGSDHSVRYI